ncbi:hypothetical protein C8F04DRAFT_1395666 [Mycena alexandri]|uniref:Uncharacterized protein n=1 Tax=Mycena alexandri TaxID=1745969 RepID=A0AAD6SVN1_9AGAR|nr:hypothetical protein C8F04DRAFT_1395666 [Mycena alexandri]
MIWLILPYFFLSGDITFDNGAFTNATLVELTSVHVSWVGLDNLWRFNDEGAVLKHDPCIPDPDLYNLWRFDEVGAVLKYDAFIPDPNLYTAASHGFDPYTPTAMNDTFQQICALQAQTCVGNNTVYDGISDCVQTLAAKTSGRSVELAEITLFGG